MRDSPIPLTRLATLVLLALVAIGAGGMLALAGRDQATPERSTAPEATERRETATGKRRPARDPLLALAARYALAARNWTPATYSRSWRRQIELAGGRFRRELEARPPGKAELRALSQDRARSAARLVRAEREQRVRGPGARVIVTLDEATRAAGQTIRGPTVNQVDLRRQAGRWRVVGFSVLPGGNR